MKASLFQKLPNVIPTKEFKQTDAWEQRKLGDALCESKVPGNKGDKAQKLSVRLWGKGVVEKKEQFLGSSTTQYYYRRAGQLIYGKLDFLHAAFGIIPEELDGFESTTDSPAFDIDDTYDTQFILLSVLRREVYEAQGKIANGSRKAKRINPDIFLQMYFFAPTLEEQKRISSLITLIDNLIAATERKKELLQKKKQAYLQLIFSQHLRFKGFTKSWEQRKLNDIAYKVTEKNNNFSIRETFTNSAELGIVSQLDFFDRNLSNAENIVNYYIVRAKDFVYNPRISAAAPVGPINCNNLEREGIISPLYTVFRTHCIDTNYLEWFFKSSDWHKFMRYYGDSGARSDRFSIKDSLFFEMPIPYPVIEEQRKIGEFFKTLDNLIAAIDKKINLLKRRKKAYLQLMFI